MDAQAWFGLFGGGSLLLAVGIAIGLSKGRASVIGGIDHRTRTLETWRTALPFSLDQTYVRHETLKGITESLERIERHQEEMAKRFMIGGAGA